MPMQPDRMHVPILFGVSIRRASLLQSSLDVVIALPGTAGPAKVVYILGAACRH